MESNQSLILRVLAGEAAPADLERLRRWRAASPEHEREYQEIARLWNLMGTAGRPDREPGDPPDADRLIAQAGIRELPTAAAVAPRRPGRTRWAITGLAASLVAALSLGTWLYHHPPAEAVTGAAFGVEQFVTGANEMSTVRLRDGSVVRLAPSTRLTMTGPEQQREVTLEGRAYFAVAKDPERPFRIRTSAGQVTVLGTRFDLQASGDDLRLLVIEGRVALASPGGDRVVSSGEMARIVAGNALPVTRVPDVDRLVTWVGNFLAFQNTPLREVAAEIERRFRVRISIPDSALGQRTVTAWFADRSLEEVLRIVCAASMADCVTRGGEVRIVAPTN